MSNKAASQVHTVALKDHKTLFSQLEKTLDAIIGLFLVGVFHMDKRLFGKKTTTLVLLDKALNTQGTGKGVVDKQWFENNN